MPQKKSYAGIWSIVLALAPLGVILLFLLPILLGDYSGEAGLAALCGIAVILYFGVHAIVATSLIGSVVGIVGIRRGSRKQGAVGLVLNVVLLGTSVALLASHYHEVYSDPERLNMAASKGDMAMVKKLLGKGFHVNQRDHKGWTPLHEAVANGYMEIAEYLLQNGADASSRSYRGESPLHLVSAWGRRRYRSLGEWDGSDVVDLLIKHGADVDARCDEYGGRTKRNWTALQIAADTNNTNIMRRLIKHGADVNAEAFNGETALYLGAGRGYIEAVEILIESRAGVNDGGSKRRYALLGAVKGRKKYMVEYLLRAGADANVADGSVERRTLNVER